MAFIKEIKCPVLSWKLNQQYQKFIMTVDPYENLFLIGPLYKSLHEIYLFNKDMKIVYILLKLFSIVI